MATIKILSNIDSSGHIDSTSYSTSSAFTPQLNTADLQITNAFGVGVTSTSEALHVDGNMLITGSLSADNIYSAGTITVDTQGFEVNSTTGHTALEVRQSGSHVAAEFYDHNNEIALWVEAQPDGTAHVGIGTSSPNARLTVVGNISASEYLYGNVGESFANLTTNSDWVDGDTYNLGQIVRYQGGIFICTEGPVPTYWEPHYGAPYWAEIVSVGDAGPQGEAGNQGSQGSQGDTGPQGYQGDTGPQGAGGATLTVNSLYNQSNDANEIWTNDARYSQVQVGWYIAGYPGWQVTNKYNNGPFDVLVFNFYAQIFPGNLYDLVGPNLPFMGSQGAQGADGNQGPQGDQGATGNQGTSGADGNQGPTGANGNSGPQGASGNSGSGAGPDGNSGPSGPSGNQGPAGANNNVTGPSGPSGNQGPAGPAGSFANPGDYYAHAGPQGGSGLSGADGNQGPSGANGNQGPSGADGNQGPSGANGNQGPQGATGQFNDLNHYYSYAGPQGDQGPQGNPGPQGPGGAQGPQGAAGDIYSTGPEGAQGDTGAQGNSGPSGAQGNSGPQGPDGNTGPQGPDGDVYATGPQGDQGPQGDNGAQGPTGENNVVTGPAGPQGNQGSQGPQGAPGPQGNEGAVGSQGDSGVVVSYGSVITLTGDAEELVTFNHNAGKDIICTLREVNTGEFALADTVIYDNNTIKFVFNNATPGDYRVSYIIGSDRKTSLPESVYLTVHGGVYTGAYSADWYDIRNWNVPSVNDTTEIGPNGLPASLPEYLPSAGDSVHVYVNAYINLDDPLWAAVSSITLHNGATVTFWSNTSATFSGTITGGSAIFTGNATYTP